MHNEYLTPPENPAADAFYDALFDQADMSVFSSSNPEAAERLAEWLWHKMGESYQCGYTNGRSDEAFARELEKS